MLRCFSNPNPNPKLRLESMNPQYQFPNPSFPAYNPLNPNPNHSVNSNFSFLHNPQFNPIQQNPLPDLPNSLSSLQKLLSLSLSTLQSFSSLVPPLSLSSNSLAKCPSNPHHWVNPSSLFLHSLHCPSPIDVGPILDTLQYPKTLKSEQQLIEQNKFAQPLHDPTAELCFSLDDYVDFDSNFFYQHCPGVVSLSDHDASEGRIFTLPGVLSVECANFGSHGDGETDGVHGSCVKTLPSELWVVRREVDQWSDYPNGYPYGVLKALICLEAAKECDLSMWLIVNSPQFGVTIDVPMRDHMLVLFRLCLKAIFREASHSFKSLFSREMDGNGGQLNPKSLNFNCPVLVEVLRWLSTQLSVLYGEANAKSFIITMLRHLLPKVLSPASFSPLHREIDQTSVMDCQNNVSTRQPSVKVIDNEVDSKADERMFSRPIFVYQIAAAIAALHERSLLEARIKALRSPIPITPYHRCIEYAHLSKKADEERQKRPDYRPLIEHDGLLSQSQHDQESNKAKTREEILAEERDYKRRRMSYRGKKLKRSIKEVMRDIIEDYMETITRAGGIGCLTKGDEGASSTFKTSPARDLTNIKLNHSMRSDQQDAHGKVAQNYQGFRDTKHTDASPSGYDRQRKETHSQGRFEDGGPSTDRNQRGYYSRSPSRDDRYGRSKEHSSHRRNHDIRELNIDDHSKRNRSSSKTRHNDYELQHSRSSSLSISSGRKDRKKLDSPARHRHRQNYKSDSFRRDDFNDRYDPSKSYDDYDDQYDDKYTRPRS